MEITTDVILKGSDWRKALNIFSPFFPQSLQPNYSIFAISISIGIMYDKQLEIAGEETPEEKENRASVPRTVLHPHNTDLDFLFQSAILTTSLVTFDETQRMDLAFNPSTEIQFAKLDFLTKYANFGVGKLLEQGSDDSIEAMQNIKSFLASTIEGYNYEIDGISEDDLSEEDLS
jgi:hypothetical protein